MVCYDNLSPFLSSDHPFSSSDHPFLSSVVPFLSSAVPFLSSVVPFLSSEYPFLSTDNLLSLTEHRLSKFQALTTVFIHNSTVIVIIGKPGQFQKKSIFKPDNIRDFLFKSYFYANTSKRSSKITQRLGIL